MAPAPPDCKFNRRSHCLLHQARHVVDSAADNSDWCFLACTGSIDDEDEEEDKDDDDDDDGDDDGGGDDGDDDKTR